MSRFAAPALVVLFAALASVPAAADVPDAPCREPIAHLSAGHEAYIRSLLPDRVPPDGDGAALPLAGIAIGERVRATYGADGPEDGRTIELLPVGTCRPGCLRTAHFAVCPGADRPAPAAAIAAVHAVVAAGDRVDPWQVVAPDPAPVAPAAERDATPATEALANPGNPVADERLGLAVTLLLLLAAAAVAAAIARLGRPVRPAVRIAGIAVGSLVAGGLLAEAALRVAAMGAPEPACRGRAGSTEAFYPENPRGYFEPDTQGGSGCFFVRTDARLHGCDRPPDPARPHVLFLGDSFTWGQGVRAEDTFPSRLSFPGAERRNCARSGAGIDDVHAIFLREAAAGRPALTVYALVLNDLGGDADVANDYVNLRDAPLAESVRAYAERTLGPLAFLRHSRYVQRLLRARVEREIEASTEAAYRRAFEPGPGLDRAFDRIDALKAGSDRFLLVVFPLFVRLDDYPFEDVHAALRREAARRGIEALDLLETFRGRDEDALVVYRTDLHPNEIAHRIAADAIRERLARLGWPGG